MLTERELVNNHVLCGQSTVVEALIKTGAIPDESLYGENIGKSWNGGL